MNDKFIKIEYFDSGAIPIVVDHLLVFWKGRQFKVYVNREKKIVTAVFIVASGSWYEFRDNIEKGMKRYIESGVYQLPYGDIFNFPKEISGTAKLSNADDWDVQVGVNVAINKAYNNFLKLKNEKAKKLLEAISKAREVILKEISEFEKPKEKENKNFTFDEVVFYNNELFNEIKNLYKPLSYEILKETEKSILNKKSQIDFITPPKGLISDIAKITMPEKYKPYIEERKRKILTEKREVEMEKARIEAEAKAKIELETEAEAETEKVKTEDLK